MSEDWRDDQQLLELHELGPFHVAELVAQFVLSEAAGWEHIPQVHGALCEVAAKIRTADWVPEQSPPFVKSDYAELWWWKWCELWSYVGQACLEEDRVSRDWKPVWPAPERLP